MKFGVSTASLYPLHTEDAFEVIAKLGVSAAEVFANCEYEASEPVVSQILETSRKSEVEVLSLHPFSSPMESVYLFTEYDRRVDEIMALYRKFFAAMNRLGAKIFVLHGAIKSSRCTPELYIRQFRLLAEAAREYGVTVAQENVCYCMSGSLDFLRMMKRELGDYARFVLDLKQARRSRESAFDYIDELGGSIIHCHCSDGNDDRDCMPVGEGNFDFSLLGKKLESVGYDGAFIVELYRRDYGDYSELKASADRLREMIQG